MAKTIYHRNYNRLLRILPGMETLEPGQSARLSAPGFMDVHVSALYRMEHTNSLVVSIAHYGEQNGDLMADPEMEIALDPTIGMAEALTFRNDYAGLHQHVYTEDGKRYRPKLKSDLNNFLEMWTKNIRAQGHKIAEAA